MGIGGYMMHFGCLLVIWGQGKIEKLYMLPIVTASTYGEREAELALIRAWEMLGEFLWDYLPMLKIM